MTKGLTADGAGDPDARGRLARCPLHDRLVQGVTALELRSRIAAVLIGPGRSLSALRLNSPRVAG
jgi:hypothetical protein